MPTPALAMTTRYSFSQRKEVKKTPFTAVLGGHSCMIGNMRSAPWVNHKNYTNNQLDQFPKEVALSARSPRPRQENRNRALPSSALFCVLLSWRREVKKKPHLVTWIKNPWVLAWLIAVFFLFIWFFQESDSDKVTVRWDSEMVLIILLRTRF